MQDKLLSLRGYAVAPQGESEAASARIIREKNLRGFLLQTRVEPPRSNAHALTVHVRVTVWSYPGKALRGEVSPKFTMSGVADGDKASEDSLIRTAIEKAIEGFTQVASSTHR